jgi:thiol-disulfide isomerase/thioredoxin
MNKKVSEGVHDSLRHSRQWTWLWSLGILTLVLVGFACGERGSVATAKNAPSKQAVADTFAVKPIDEKRIAGLLAEAKGKVVFINLWAMWCAPCKEEFPDILKLRGKYRAQGLEVVFISVDELEDVEGRIKPFLKKHDVDFTTYIKQVKNDEAFINFMNKEWSGALPAAFIYDKTGTLAVSILGEKTLEEFEVIVTPLLE